MNKTIQVFTDGATKGQNKLGITSIIGLGVYIPSINKKYSVIDNGLSNNEAEFKALILALKICKHLELDNLCFNLDSKMVVNMMNNSKNNPISHNFRANKQGVQRIIDLCRETFALSNQFANINYVWIPRAENTMADILSKYKLKQNNYE